MSDKSKNFNDKFIRDILKPYAYKAFKDLSIESHYVIEEFYRDYTPELYKRTYGIKNLFMPELIKTKKGYNIVFTYMSDNITTEHRDNDEVFEHSFVYGYHGGKYSFGYEKTYVPRMNPSPWKQIELFVKTYKM